MALPATSPMVVDLSGDNDSAGALAAAASIPTVSPDAAFERSCDNPECSAPKLISLVPKKETSEFITEPVIMNQPTLINGFTTVFQIDGIGAKMNDIMYGDNSDAGTSNGATTKPRSVFRIVPNTHAHIVNYVVVDGAGETMRKIKANDADTMRKLLDSQRLSAEQMLKKLIGKAFMPPTGKHTEQSVPLPISYKGHPPAPVSVPIPNVIPASGYRLSSGTLVKPIGTPMQGNVLPAVPAGITITPISANPLVVPAPTPTNIDSSKPITPTTPNVSAPVLRKALATPQQEDDKGIGRATGLKRKLTTTPQPDVIKKLRSRSPKQKTPLAIGLQRPSATSSPVIKLPTLPTKLPTKAPISANATPVAQSTPLPKKLTEDALPPTKAAVTSTLNKNKATEENEKSIVAPDASSNTIVNKATESTSTSPAAKAVASTQSPLTASTSFKESLPATTPKVDETSSSESQQTVSPKPKPLMGPASKMIALRALAAAKASAVQVHKNDVPSKIGGVLASKPTITQIGETVITSSSATIQKTDPNILLKIKPCTVSIPKVDVPIKIKITDFQAKENTVSTPKIDAASASKPNVAKVTTETTKTDAMLSSKETVQPVSDTPTVDEDPLFISTAIPSTKANVAPAPKADENALKPNAHMTRASLPTRPIITKISPKTPTITMLRKSDTALLPKVNPAANKPIPSTRPEGVSIKVTRASTPRVAAPLPTKPSGPLPTKQPGPLPTKPTGKLPTKPAAVLPTKPTRVSTLVNKSATPSANASETSASPPLQPKITKLSVSTRKSGVMTIPITSPHPNLKISSVISGGSAVAATLGDDTNSSDVILNESSSGPDIEKLQQELADLRRTVARLTKKKL